MNIMDIYFAPSKAFAALKEKPQWVTPFIIVLVVVALTAALTVNFSRDEIMARQQETLREQGRSEEEIERAMQFTSGPIIFLGSAISATIFTAVLMLLFALIINLFVPLFGGESGFKTIFSVICFSSLVLVPSAILKLILIAITRSPYVTTSLALLAPGLAKDTFVYKLLAGFDFFIMWEMILVALGINITNGIAKKNAYVLVFVIWIISIFIGVGISSIFGRGM